MTDLDRLLASKLDPLEPLPAGDYVVYGAGNIGREVAAHLSKSGYNVRAFIDARAHGDLNGVPILSPDTDAARKLAVDGCTAAIGVFNYTADPWPIVTLLQQLGFHRIASFNELVDQLDLPPHFWLTHRRHLLDHVDRIRAAWDLLEDDVSREIFLDSIRLRLTLDLRLLREPTWGQQYLPDDLPQPKMPLRLIDGGAFTGDTLEFLLEKGASFDAVAAFEPDPGNFKALCTTVRKHRSSLGNTILLPCGVSDNTAIASFRAGQGAGSAVVADGDIHVQLVALDEVLPSFAPTYIKLDIEGSELAALRGAAEMVRQHRPSLAVCVYHTPDHLWEIPLYIRELLPDHRIALRHHTFQAFELVAYAFPRE